MKLHRDLKFLLDESFGARELPAKLAEMGFDVTPLGKHLARDAKDPEVIRFCGEQGLVLLTCDKDLENSHVEELKKAKIAVVATSHNHQKMEIWVAAFRKAKAKLFRELSKRHWPLVIHLSKDGNLSKVLEIQPGFRSGRARLVRE